MAGVGRLGFAHAGAGTLVRAAGAGATMELVNAGDRSDSLGRCVGGNTPEAGRAAFAVLSAIGGTELRKGAGRGAPSGNTATADGGRAPPTGDFAGCNVRFRDSLTRGMFGPDVADGVERTPGAGVLARGDELGEGVLARDELGTAVLARDELGTAALARDELGTAALARDELGEGVLSRDELCEGVLARDELGTAALARDELGTAALARDELGTAALALRKAAVGVLARGKAGAGVRACGKLSAGVLARDELAAGVLARGRAGAGVLARDELAAGVLARVERNADAASASVAIVCADAIAGELGADLAGKFGGTSFAELADPSERAAAGAGRASDDVEGS